MDQSFCYISDKETKKKIVIEFAEFYYNHGLGKGFLLDFAGKISERAAMISAVVDGETAGFVAYYRNDISTGTAYITAVVLKDRFRGFGIGTTMLQNVISDCKSNGFKIVRLEVDNENRTAVHLYTKLGFRKEKESEHNSSYYCLTL